MSNIPALPDPTNSIDSLDTITSNGRSAGLAQVEGGEPDVMRFLQAILRYKWVVVIAVVIGVGGGLAASQLVRPQYEAVGKIWVSDSKPSGNNLGPIQEDVLTEASGWVQLLKSFTVLDTVVHRQKLFVTVMSSSDRPFFASFGLKDRFQTGSYRLTTDANAKTYELATAEGPVVERGSSTAKVGDNRGFVWSPPATLWASDRTIDFSVESPRDIARELEQAIGTLVIDKGPVMQLSLDGTDSREITETLNAVMNRFVEVAAELKREKLDKQTEILQEQLAVAEANMRRAEQALQAYRVQVITLPGTPVAGGTQETRDPAVEQYFDMKTRLDNMVQDRIRLEDIESKVADGELAWDALSGVQAAQGNQTIRSLLDELARKKAELSTLLLRYTEEHIQVKPVLAAIASIEEVNLPQAVQRLRIDVNARVQDLEVRVAEASTELKAIPPRMIEETRLQAEWESARNIHSRLRNSHEEARLAAVSSVPDVRVLDPARVEFTPTTNKRPIVMAGFTIGSVGLALLGILIRDRGDRRVRYPEQVTSGLGLPILGAVPRAKGGLRSQDERTAAHLNEAFRELRLAIVHAHGSAGPLLVSVTSPESGDGKSTVSGCLATVFAGQGFPVLLIDGDIRRGDLHRPLEVRRAPGLTDFLSGRATLDEILQVTERGFTLIGSGTRMQAGPELLGSSAMSQLIRAVRARFGVIIVDTPPLGAGVDAYILGTVTGNMVLVLRTGRTDGQLAEIKLSQVDRLPIRILGAVLNDVPPSRMYRSYTYLPGYQAEDEHSGVLQGVGSDDDD